MTFNNASGNAVTITLPEPKASLTAAQIEAVMDQIITKNIFLTSGGELISKRDVKIVDTTTDDLYDHIIAKRALRPKTKNSVADCLNRLSLC